MAQVDPAAMKVFYDESKAVSDALVDLLAEYRSNTTKVLALSTAALTLFGFEDSDKGAAFWAALVFYAVGVGLALWIYWPVRFRTNEVKDLPDAVAAGTPLPVAKVHFDLGRAHQAAFAENNGRLTSKFGLPKRFSALILASASVVVLGGINTAISEPAAPPGPTEIVLIQEET